MAVLRKHRERDEAVFRIHMVVWNPLLARKNIPVVPLRALILEEGAITCLLDRVQALDFWITEHSGNLTAKTANACLQAVVNLLERLEIEGVHHRRLHEKNLFLPFGASDFESLMVGNNILISFREIDFRQRKLDHWKALQELAERLRGECCGEESPLKQKVPLNESENDFQWSEIRRQIPSFFS